MAFAIYPTVDVFLKQIYHLLKPQLSLYEDVRVITFRSKTVSVPMQNVIKY